MNQQDILIRIRNQQSNILPEKYSFHLRQIDEYNQDYNSLRIIELKNQFPHKF